MRPTPDTAGFAEAQDTKRTLLGADVVFLFPPTMTWPPGTAIDPETDMPYDPMVDPLSSGAASATLRAGVFFKAANRGGAEHSEVSSPIGMDVHTRIFATLPISDYPRIVGAQKMIFHGDTFQIVAIKRDEIVSGYIRTLVYGAAEG